jgi:uncharacterized alpha-E superfamily protein
MPLSAPHQGVGKMRVVGRRVCALMLSRIAESLYWMSRYLERADNTARLMEINLLYLVEAEEHLSETVQWRPLVSISGSEAAFAQYYDGAEVTAQHVIQFMTKGPANPNAIHPSLRLARENARVVRDRISKEMWQGMNELWWMVDTRLKSPLLPERAAAFYASVRDEVARFHGLTSSTMMRGEAYGFYSLGTFVERADMTARILDVKYHILLPDAAMVGSPLDYYQWAALLKSLSGFEAYRRKYHTGMRPIDVAQHAIFERNFPRSLEFAVDRIQRALEMIGAPAAESQSRAAVGRLLAHLEHHSAESVMRAGLHEFLQAFLQCIGVLNTALQADYFAAHFGAEPCAM